MRGATRRERDLIQDDFTNQGDDEPDPAAVITIPTIVDNINTTYTMGIGDWGAAQLLRHGWRPGQGLEKGNGGRVVSFVLTSMSLDSPRPLTQPPGFVAPLAHRERIGFSLGLYSRPIDYIRPNTYPSRRSRRDGEGMGSRPRLQCSYKNLSERLLVGIQPVRPTNFFQMECRLSISTHRDCYPAIFILQHQAEK